MVAGGVSVGMPNYVYQVILENGEEGPTFELDQGVLEETLSVHPVTGHEVRRVVMAPNISKRYTAGREKQLMDNKYIEKAGFMKYERDKVTGRYHKVAGKEGPDTITV